MTYRHGVVLLAFALVGSAAESSGGARAGLRQAFEHARYALQDSGHGTYRGENPAQRLTLQFDGREARLSHPDGSVSFHLTGYGYGERLGDPAQARLTGAGNRVEYRRGDLTEWYVNGSQGLEQGFTLARRPGMGGDGQPLVIAIGVSGGLRPAQEADGAVLFGAALRYAGLKAVDARGRAMPSRLQARDGEIRLIVEDRDAQYPLVVDPTWTEQQALTASDGAAYDMLGMSVSIDGNTAVAGAEGKNNNQGAAYVFVRSGGVWSQQAELTAPDAVSGDYFGFNVSVSGDTAVIGANGKNTQKGAAYIFVRSAGVWSLQQELTAADGSAGDGFGWPVSVSGDTALIGAPGKNGWQGAAYVYVRSGTAWTLQQELTASDGAANDQFGSSASLSGDTAVIGTDGRYTYQGAAYVFVRSGTAWSQQQELTASDGVAYDYFGNSVSVSGNTALIGAQSRNSARGAAYVFVRNGTAWSQQQELTASDSAASNFFGGSVSVYGYTAVIGAFSAPANKAAAYVFVNGGTAWSQQQELASSVSGDGFGRSVSISGDTLVVGAVAGAGGHGAAYPFVLPRLGTNSLLVGSAAGTSSVVLSYNGAWTAVSNSSFLHVASGSASGTASGVVVFTYDAFTGTGSRSGTLTIAGLTLTVTQAGTNYVGPGPVLTLVSTGLDEPFGVTVDGSGNVYIADTYHSDIKEWNAATQLVSTLVPSNAGLNYPSGVAVDVSGNVYIADTNNGALKVWSPATQQVTTLVSGMNLPYGAALDVFGNVYITDLGHYAIQEWSAARQQASTLISGLAGPLATTVDVAGNVYIADSYAYAIKEWSPATGLVNTLVSGISGWPTDVAVDGSGSVYIADANASSVTRWSAATQQVTAVASAGLSSCWGVAVDGAGNLYIADSADSAIKGIPNAFVGPASLTEPASAGSDSLLPVLPATANLTGIFAPVSDQTWLTIGPVASGAVGFSFTANTTSNPRTAHIALLGHQIAVTQSGVTNGTVSLAMGIGNGPPGQTAQAPILLGFIGTDAPTAVQADLSFDTTKLTFASASAGAALTSAGKSLSANTLANGNVRLLGAGLNQTAIPNGVVANVTFTLNPQFTWGSTTVTLANCAASDSVGNLLSISCTAGTIVAFTCDLNGDGNVNVADVQVIINEALGVIPAVHDLNHDGVVNVGDVQKVINAALGLGCPY